VTPQQPGQVPVADLANGLLCETPAQLVTQIADTPAGQRLVMTVRTSSATLTVFLGGADAKTWARQLAGEAAAMSGSGLVVANGTVTP
jgi:hypothetical protein